MSFNFSDRGWVSKNGKQSSLHREHAIYNSARRSSFFNHPTSPKGMKMKLFLTILKLIGFSSYICGILLNIGNWKADLLFLAGVAFALLKFIRLTLKTWQSYKREEIELKILKKKSQE